MIQNIYFTICIIIMMMKFWKVFIKHCEKDLEAFDCVSYSDIFHNATAGIIVSSIYFIIFAIIYKITVYIF